MKLAAAVAASALLLAALSGGRRSPWIDVMDSGAKCDGITDDTQAVQKAFNHLAAGGALRIPNSAHGCKVTSTIVAPRGLNNARIFGDAPAWWSGTGGPASSLIYAGPPGQPLLSFTNILWIQLDHLLLDGGGLASAGISVSFATTAGGNNTFDHFGVANATDGVLVIGEPGADNGGNRYTNCRISDGVENGIHYRNGSALIETIQKCQLSLADPGSTSKAIFLESFAGEFYLDDVYTGMAYGVYSDSTSTAIVTGIHWHSEDTMSALFYGQSVAFDRPITIVDLNSTNVGGSNTAISIPGNGGTGIPLILVGGRVHGNINLGMPIVLIGTNVHGTITTDPTSSVTWIAKPTPGNPN